jgi:small conductance mechanosensitive channel
MQGQVGKIDEIQIFNTIITSLDNKKVIVPNSVATSGIITNLSAKPYLRVDLNVHIPYEANFEQVQAIILDAIKQTPKVLTDPAPYVEIEAFAENGLKLVRTSACYRGRLLGRLFWR